MNPKEFKIEIHRPEYTAGNQTVGVYDTCIRITHIPTGTTVSTLVRFGESNKEAKERLLERLLSLI